MRDDPPTPPSPVPPDGGVPHGAGVSVLVVDDDEYVAAYVLRVLRDAGYVVVLARNGRESLRLFKEGRPDLVLTDLVMPDMEGLETIQMLRKIDPAARIIAMSGGGRGKPGTYLDMAARLGACQTIEKPFDRETLLAVIAAARAG